MSSTNSKTPSKAFDEAARPIVKRMAVITTDFYETLFTAAGFRMSDLSFRATATPEDGKILDEILTHVSLDLFIAFGVSACIGGYTNVEVSKRDSSLWKRVITFKEAEYTMGDFLSVVEVRKIDPKSRSDGDKGTITMSKIVNICAPLAQMYLKAEADRTSNMFKKNYHAFLADKPDELPADSMREYIFTGCKRVIPYSSTPNSICQTYLRFCKWMDSQNEPPTNFALSERRYFHASAGNPRTSAYKFDTKSILSAKAVSDMEEKFKKAKA